MTNIVATPEILGAFIAGGKKVNKFAENPEGYLAELGIEPNIKVKAVNNSADTMNLALPFYSDLEKTAGAVVSDEDLEAASGGAGDIHGNNRAVAIVNFISSYFVNVAVSVVEEAATIAEDRLANASDKDSL